VRQPVGDAWPPRYIDLPGEHFAARRQVERIEASRTRRPCTAFHRHFSVPSLPGRLDWARLVNCDA